MILARCFAYLRAVLWSFFGVRRGAAAREEIATLRPLWLIATGVGLAALFVLFLIWVARTMVAWLGA